MDWKLAPSLIRLRAEVDARWKGRDKRSDGDIGDAAHRSRVSAHNPKDGYVDAIDIDVTGVDAKEIVRAAIKHPATHIVIWSRTIWTRESGFRARQYLGQNPHTSHVHVEVTRNSAGRMSKAGWLGPVPVKPPVKKPAGSFRLLRLTQPEMRGEDVAAAQRALVRAKFPIKPDGVYGVRTDAAIRAFQRRHGLTVDGVVGRQTLALLSRT